MLIRFVFNPYAESYFSFSRDDVDNMDKVYLGTEYGCASVYTSGTEMFQYLDSILTPTDMIKILIHVNDVESYSAVVYRVDDDLYEEFIAERLIPHSADLPF